MPSPNPKGLRGVSLVELLVATTILAIVALAAGGIFGKFYSMFGKNAETVRAVRIANELLSRYQTRWGLDFAAAPPPCGETDARGDTDVGLNLGPFCYQIDLYRDTAIGAFSQDRDSLTAGQRQQLEQLNAYTAWMDVADIPETGDSHWLRARLVRIRVLRTKDVFCREHLLPDGMGLPYELHFQPLYSLTGDYFINRAFEQTAYDPTSNVCYPQRANPAVTPTPIPLAEAATVIALNPRTMTSRKGIEYVTYSTQPVFDPVSGRTASKYRPQTLQPDGSAQVSYDDPGAADTPNTAVTATAPRRCTAGKCTVDLYWENYPGILNQPPAGWIPDPATGAITFDPLFRSSTGKAAIGPDPVIRYVLWTFAGPDASLSSAPQFRHRLAITTFTDRLVHEGATSQFLTSIPQAAGKTGDNYIPLWISVTGLPDDDGLCVDELVPGGAAPAPCNAINNFVRIVIPTFPSSQNSPYEASVNVPPGPAITLNPLLMRLPNIYGLAGTMARSSAESNPQIKQLASNSAPSFGRPHLIHIALPPKLLAAWPGATATTPINLSIARVRFQS